jgi:hypothetical protein
MVHSIDPYGKFAITFCREAVRRLSRAGAGFCLYDGCGDEGCAQFHWRERGARF